MWKKIVVCNVFCVGHTKNAFNFEERVVGQRYFFVWGVFCFVPV